MKKTLLAIVLTWSAAVSAVGQAAPQNPVAYGPLMPVPDIPGVVKGGTPIVTIKEGVMGTEGAIAMPDGTLLFTEQEANRIDRIDKDDRITTFVEDTHRTVGLAWDTKGRLIGTATRVPQIEIFYPQRGVLVDAFEGQHLMKPNDLVASGIGAVYFTDADLNNQPGFPPHPPGRKNAAFAYLPGGTLVKIDDLDRANGITLSPDEKTLYIANGATILAYDVEKDGTVKNQRPFTTLVGLRTNANGQVQGGADGICIDNAGRLYASTATGVQVFSPKGQHLGTIPTAVTPQSIAFAGPGRKTLYIVGRNNVYRLQMIAEGPTNRTK